MKNIPFLIKRLDGLFVTAGAAFLFGDITINV